MSKVKAVIYGVGAMNTICTRMLLEKDVEIVAAISRSETKVGKDLGRLTGLDRDLGVVVTDDAKTALAESGADIAVIAVNSYMADAVEQLRHCAEAGVSAVTLSEEALYPWNTSPEITAELDTIAKRTGATLTGTGHQDTYWVNIVALIMGTAHRIESVTGRASWNVDDYGPEVAGDQQVGTTIEEFQQWLSGAERPPTFGRNVLDALVADAGLTITSITSSTRPDIATTTMHSNALNLDVEDGRVIGFTDVDEIHTAEGVVLRFEMSGRVYGDADGDINEWSIAGEPDLVLSNGTVPTQITTCTQIVNRIPDVINAAPGFVTMEKLPRLRYRAHPLHSYVHAAKPAAVG